ncbi:extracellular solute-binding protein [Nitratireductor aquibiodomus RA22]|uniref:Extracellular solute-binding protein n=1 Tax=Nitratireductor aquibiodomus RA22 TaxID=1189611 RepID=I5BVE7_9HYPH|nr:ABC transporter substrate-binding protein [Nitratireductor aquibiodomus]EIM73549.1 extracellular solute-binding protein [Nitratireductor aquibiodomus RA22]
MGTILRELGRAGLLFVGTALALTTVESKAQAPVEGGEIEIRINSDLRSTDGLDRDGNSDTILHHIFETLVAYRDDLSVGPLLAESWDVSEDGRVYTFTLRGGATFHNGDPVTSADVKWNWDRRMDPTNEWFCIPYFDGSQGLKVTAVETPDDRTVSFTLEEPNALFLTQLANIQCNGWIASPKNVDEDGNWNENQAIGSGSFKLTEWRRGQFVTLERYENYQPLDEERSGLAGDRTAYLDTVRFTIIPDTAASETALFANEIDVLPAMEAVRATDAKARGMNVLTGPGLSWSVILLQSNDPLLSDARIRRAIAHAIDFEQIANMRTEGQAEFNPSAVAQASMFFDESFTDWPEYDPAAARALLDEASYAGQPIKLQANTRYQGMYENGVIVQAMLAAAGFNVELEVLDWAAQLDNYLAGTFQLQSFGYSARLDPSLLYGILIGDKKTTPTRQWQNEDAYQLYLNSSRTEDREERQAIFKQIHELMAQDIPILGLYYETVTDVTVPSVKGYEVWPGDKPRAWGVWKEKQD